ncbi:MAG TPA: hypothetical protein VKP00_15015 [Gemmatimonadaceae bacterium]|nr:hypothetical protein [Gemmatimonadaceae bacterium]
MSFFRLAANKIAQLLGVETDPAVDAKRVQLYAKDVGFGGGVQLHARIPAGNIYQLTPSATPLPDITDNPGVQVDVNAFLNVNSAAAIQSPFGPFSQTFRVGDPTTANVILAQQFGAGTITGVEMQNVRATRQMSLGNALVNVAAGGTFNDQQIFFGPAFQVNPPGGGATITGFAPETAAPWQTQCLYFGRNTGGGNCTLTHEDVLSLPDNRIVLVGAAPLVIPQFGGWVMYKATKPAGFVGGTERWFVIAKNI